MSKNIKRMFFVLTLVTLLVTVGAVCAADDANSTTTVDSSIHDVATVSNSASNTLVTELTTTTSNDNKVDTKTIKKEDKKLKTNTKTVDVNNYNEIISTINNAVNDEENDEYIINLNDGNYELESNTIFDSGNYKKNIIINANNQNLLSNYYIRWDNNCNLTINDAIMYHKIQNQYGQILTINNSNITNKLTNRGTLYLNNTYLDGEFINYATIYCFDNVTMADSIKITQPGTIITNDTNILKKLGFYKGINTIENEIINSAITNEGNLTIINTTINGTIKNQGNLTVINSTIQNTITNLEHLIIINSTINSINENIYNPNIIDNQNYCTITNSSFENIKMYRIISNQGNLTMINCTIRNCSMTQSDGALIANGGNLTINDMNMSDNFLNLTYSISLFRNIGSNPTSLTLNNFTFANNELICIPYGSGSVNFIGATTVYINNSVFTNNSGFVKTDDSEEFDYKSNLISCTNGVISNTVFENNKAMAILGGNINLTNCTFKNNSMVSNSRTGFSAMVNIMSSGNVSDCKFIDNTLNINNSRASNSEPRGALKITNGTVTNCIFENNTIECNSVWLTVNGAALSGTNINITENNFTNNKINTVKGTSASTETYEFDFGVSGYGVDIYTDGTSTITGNNFINSTGNQDVGSIYASGKQSTITITNNTFINCRANKETIAVVSEDKVIQDNNFINNTIGFKKLNITTPDKVYSNEDITVSLDVELAYPDNYDSDILEKTDYQWYIDGQINTDKDTQKTVHIGTENVVVYVTPTVSNNRSRVVAISPIVLTDIIITPDNINKYVFDGELIGVNQNSKLVFQGQFNNTGEIYSSTNNLLFDGKNATFTNTAFVIEASDVTIQNMNINNTDTSKYIITTTGNNNIIQNNTLTQYNTNGQTAAIYNLNSNNTQTRNNKITVSGPAKAIQYGETAAVANTQAILQEAGNNNTITQNNIIVQNSTNPEDDAFSTIEAITAPRQTNTEISYNNITITGARFNYAINSLNNINNETINNNNINVTGYRYADGIQVGDNAEDINITQNNITITCLNTTPVDEAAISYGIIATSQGGNTANNVNITENNININGAVNYGIEVYTATNTNINNNNITLTGVKSMGIGYAHSPNGTITQNTITTNDDSTQPLNGVTEEIQPANTGIKIQQDSHNIQIENNTITTNDKAKTDKTIDTDSQNTTIKNNKLTSSNGYGDETTNTLENNTITENNTIETTTTINVPETIITKTPTTITANVTTINGTPINGGVVTFTKANEAIAQAEVIDGVATATVTFTQEEDATITASYTPESSGLSKSSAEATTSIQAPQTQLNIEDVELTAGETITLTATVTDQAGNNITGGKIIFKVNGKTVKDTNGKVIYAKVVDGVATIEYIVPDSLAGKDVNITASYSGSAKYNKESTTITKTIAAQEPTLTITPITDNVQTGSTITLKAKIAAGDKAITTGKIVFKINGKTVKDANGKVIYAKVDANGEVSVDYNLGNLKAGSYTIEATFISPNYDKITSNTTMTVVKA